MYMQKLFKMVILTTYLKVIEMSEVYRILDNYTNSIQPVVVSDDSMILVKS